MLSKFEVTCANKLIELQQFIMKRRRIQNGIKRIVISRDLWIQWGCSESITGIPITVAPEAGKNVDF